MNERIRKEYEDLVHTHYREITIFCYRRLRNIHDAQDAAQETFKRFWQISTKGQETIMYPRAFLYGIAWRVCDEKIRGRIHGGGEPVDPTQIEGLDLRLKGQAMVAALNAERKKMIMDVLIQCMERLSERYKTAVRLYYLEGMTYEKVGDTLDIKTVSVFNLISAAKPRYINCLEKNGIHELRRIEP